MSPVPLTLLLAAAAGALTAAQPPTNALLARAFGSPLSAALVSFLIGSAALAFMVAVSPVRPDTSAVRALPWYAWIGGLYGAFFVAVAAFAAPRIGVGLLVVALITGQLVTAVVLDHLGALGLERQPLSWTRVAGLVLVIAGAALVRRG